VPAPVEQHAPQSAHAPHADAVAGSQGYKDNQKHCADDLSHSTPPLSIS
jgi:hypothetical protein